jgi:hypothetical protein
MPSRGIAVRSERRPRYPDPPGTIATACPSGDELELVLDGLDQRAVGRGPSVRARVDAPEGVPRRVGRPGQGLVGDVVECHGFLAGQPVVAGHQQHPGLVVEHCHVQPVGRERQPRQRDVHAVFQERGGCVLPVQVLEVHVRFRVAAA